MNNSSKIFVKPEIDRLINIIDFIKRGKLVLPEFQRDYIWNKKQRLDLFDSIKRGFPIGSLLFWDPDHNIYEYNNKIGPYNLNIKNPNFVYIIDGYQRVTTLFCALINPDDNSVSYENDRELQEYTIYYDLENEEFLQSRGQVNEAHILPLYVLIDTFLFLTYSDQLKSVYNDEKSSTLINRAKELANTLIDYSIAYVNIHGGEMQDSVEIFSRINSKGSEMSPIWMLNALSYKEDFKFSKEVEKFKEKLVEYNFEDIKTEIILQCIESNTGKIYFDVKTENLAKKENFKELCLQTFESMLLAIDFLHSELNVLHSKFLPYNLQLVFINYFFFNNDNISNEQKAFLKDWFWKTSYSNYFSINSLSSQRKAFEIFKDFKKEKITNPFYLAKKEKINVLPMPNNLNFGSVRSKTFALFLIKNALKNHCDRQPQFIDFFSLSVDTKEAEFMVPIFDFNNKDYISKNRNKDVSNLLIFRDDHFDYEANFITDEMFNILDYNIIGEMRYNKIREEEKKFINSFEELTIFNDDWKYLPF